jgi:hypothetical protein
VAPFLYSASVRWLLFTAALPAVAGHGRAGIGTLQVCIPAFCGCVGHACSTCGKHHTVGSVLMRCVGAAHWFATANIRVGTLANRQPAAVSCHAHVLLLSGGCCHYNKSSGIRRRYIRHSVYRNPGSRCLAPVLLGIQQYSLAAPDDGRTMCLLSCAVPVRLVVCHI